MKNDSLQIRSSAHKTFRTAIDDQTCPFPKLEAWCNNVYMLLASGHTERC